MGDNHREWSRNRRHRERLRTAWAQLLPIECPRCGRPVEPWHAWDLDHVDGIRVSDRVQPAHASCNRARRPMRSTLPPAQPSREW